VWLIKWLSSEWRFRFDIDYSVSILVTNWISESGEIFRSEQLRRWQIEGVAGREDYATSEGGDDNEDQGSEDNEVP
jgi:hypothetical protein